ncbi:hypothetical protein HIV01_003495 [Lysobacter arenosi]|uniref:Uncharacterized protein n=1 Tax=Lysobacter arenosi TaxID=2795387 RepID=A0ABX7RBT4_9GAMM|nr:hypothetical protein [Lysobacter arenosi]QSX75609.1 hypothetical protein HIV01_003495 [Lysobacter arenosi]
MSTVLTNPEVLSTATPDLTGGIPCSLWNGTDDATRRRLFDEYRRQIARRRSDDEADRACAIANILARTAAPTPDDHEHGEVARLQALLIEAAAVAGSIATTAKP